MPGCCALSCMGLLLLERPSHRRYKGEAAILKSVGGLRHADPHVVSITPDGSEVVISLCRSATLDTSHLVSHAPKTSPCMPKQVEAGMALKATCALCDTTA